jgi:SAM-dependent methyltransferase
MLQTLVRQFYRLPVRIQRPVMDRWYDYMSQLDRDADMIFMNYGWASVDEIGPPLPLAAEDEQDRYSIQLYHQVANAVDLRGKEVLEVGCGRGGGASYVMRYLQPRSLAGVDLAPQAVKFCRGHYATPGLSFVRGDAESLEFDDATFDAVINVESSHCYLSLDRFLSGVHRVLKPGGHFLYTDRWDKTRVDAWRQQLRHSGLYLVEEEDISANVVRALELDNARKQELIRRKVPRMLWRIFDEFAGMEGTHSFYNTLCTGERVYLRFVLQKAD